MWNLLDRGQGGVDRARDLAQQDGESVQDRLQRGFQQRYGRFRVGEVRLCLGDVSARRQSGAEAVDRQLQSLPLCFDVGPRVAET